MMAINVCLQLGRGASNTAAGSSSGNRSASGNQGGGNQGGGRGLPAGVTMEQSPHDERSYSFSVGGKKVVLDVSDGVVDFSVGGNFNRGDLQGRNADRAALTIMRIFKHDVSTRPDGYRYETQAYTGDGYGQKRADAYQRVGFSAPNGGKVGHYQEGIVRNGKLIPYSE